jgi:hypothetical protein
MRRILFAFAALLVAVPALAQEPAGCDKFKWPLDKERTMLASAATLPASGAVTVTAPLASAFKLGLFPADAAKLPMPPTRAPKPGTNAGAVTIPALPKDGIYRITLSEGAWIDVFQDNKEVKSVAFSGATGCADVRKSVKFDLDAKPFVIEISGTGASSVSFVITPD